MPIIRLITKSVGAGIGLASEAIAGTKENKTKERGRSVSPNPQTTLPRSRSPSGHDHKSAQNSDDDSSSSDSDVGNDKADWALDEAAAAFEPLPAYSETLESVPPMPVDELAHEFQRHHPTTAPTQSYQPLPMPVILPQRRPKDKSRGFVRGYAPILGECSGIDQQTFLDFLNDFDKASKASPVFDVINLACFAAGMVPNPIAMGVTIAVQVVSRTAQEIQGRHRTNTFLDQINESLFKPRGLYCMIMTFKPESDQAVIGLNLTSHDAALTKTLSPPTDKLHAQMKNIRLTSGVTKGEFGLPQAAPLIYPALDAAVASASASAEPLPEKKQNMLQASGGAIASYLDRRAQARYVSQHSSSQLSSLAPPPDKAFASRFSDPNHPANSGTILGLLTGGHFDPKARKRGRRAQRQAARRGETLTPEEIHNAEMGRLPRKNRYGEVRKGGLVRRVMQKDVLYLTVVNLPSESEMREMRQELDRMKKEGSFAGFGSR